MSKHSRERRLWKILVPATLACALGPVNIPAQEPAAPMPAEGPKVPTAPVKEKIYNNDDRFKFNLPVARLANNPGEHNKYFLQVRKVLKGDMNLSEMPTFDAYYTRYLFPLMTLTDENELAELTKRRNGFFRDHLVYCTNPDVHQHLVDLTFAEMRNIAKGDFHPAVRYNAMYIISQLNTQEPVQLGNIKAVPDPYSPALPVMVDEFKKDETPEALKVACLLGILRHLDMDTYRTSDRKMQAAQKADVVKLLTTLVQTPEPPAGRSVAAQNWLRRRAIEGLATAGFVQPDPAIVKTITDVIGNDKEALAVRVDATEALGKLNIAPPVKLEVTAIVETLGRLALTSIQEESKHLEALQKQDLDRVRVTGGAGGSAGSGGMGGSGGMAPMMSPMPGYGGSGKRPKAGDTAHPEDYKKYRVELAARRLRAGLNAIEYALLGGDHDRFMKKHERVELNTGGNPPVRGLANVAKAPKEKELVTALIFTENNKIGGLLIDLDKVLEEPELDHYLLKQDLKEPLQRLSRMVKERVPVAAEPAVEAGEDEGLPAAAPAKAKAAPKVDVDAAAAEAPAKPASKPAAIPAEEPAAEEPPPAAAAPKKAAAVPDEAAE